MAEVIVDARYDITPPDEWPEDKRSLFTIKLRSDADRWLSTNVECALDMLDRAKEHCLWENIGLPDWESFLEEVGLTDEAIARYREGLSLLRADGVRGKVTKAMIDELPALRDEKGGRPKAGANLSNLQVSSPGNSNERMLRRLKRDGRDDLLDQIAAGEISVNKAAIQAGYRKVKTPLEQLEHWWKKASDDERTDFIERHA